MKSRKEIQKQSFANFPGKHLCWSLFFDKVADLKACNFIKKETLTQVLFCEICEIFKNTFFYRTPPLAASRNNIKKRHVYKM